MTADELSSWLVDRGLAEVGHGYGHATGDDVAEAILAEFFVTPKKLDCGCTPFTGVRMRHGCAVHRDHETCWE